MYGVLFSYCGENEAANCKCMHSSVDRELKDCDRTLEDRNYVEMCIVQSGRINHHFVSLLCIIIIIFCKFGRIDLLDADSRLHRMRLSRDLAEWYWYLYLFCRSHNSSLW